MIKDLIYKSERRNFNLLFSQMKEVKVNKFIRVRTGDKFHKLFLDDVKSITKIVLKKRPRIPSYDFSDGDDEDTTMNGKKSRSQGYVN